jgi:hypothetical protein
VFPVFIPVWRGLESVFRGSKLLYKGSEKVGIKNFKKYKGGVSNSTQSDGVDYFNFELIMGTLIEYLSRISSINS